MTDNASRLEVFLDCRGCEGPKTDQPSWSGTWTVNDRWSLVVSGYVPYGRGSNRPALGSEFGAPPTVVFVQVKMYRCVSNVEPQNTQSSPRARVTVTSNSGHARFGEGRDDRTITKEHAREQKRVWIPAFEMIGALLTLVGLAWGCWTARNARDLSLVAALGAFSIQTYVTLGPVAHENHWFGAVPLLVLAAAGRKRFVPVLGAITAVASLNQLFWGFHLRPDTYFRFSPSAATIPLAAVNCAVYLWHAAVFRAECAAPGLPLCAHNR
jgi:hypothetical protein